MYYEYIIMNIIVLLWILLLILLWVYYEYYYEYCYERYEYIIMNIRIDPFDSSFFRFCLFLPDDLFSFLSLLAAHKIHIKYSLTLIMGKKMTSFMLSVLTFTALLLILIVFYYWDPGNPKKFLWGCEA